jgi:hypothetical protein
LPSPLLNSWDQKYPSAPWWPQRCSRLRSRRLKC